MASGVSALFNDPETLANYLGESVGTHFSAALRAADAYGRHLAGNPPSPTGDRYDGEGLREFWKELIGLEQVTIGSPVVMRTLGTEPQYFFGKFLRTADAAYRKCYGDGSETQRKKLGHTQHAQCLRMLRDPTAAGMADRFAVQNQVTLWSQVFRITTGSSGRWGASARAD